MNRPHEADDNYLEQSPETGFFPLTDEPDLTGESDDEPDTPFCECGEEPDMEEDAFNQCKACGKPIYAMGDPDEHDGQ